MVKMKPIKQNPVLISWRFISMNQIIPVILMDLTIRQDRILNDFFSNHIDERRKWQFLKFKIIQHTGELDKQLVRVDTVIGMLLDGLKMYGLEKCVNIVLSRDLMIFSLLKVENFTKLFNFWWLFRDLCVDYGSWHGRRALREQGLSGAYFWW